MKHYAWVFFLVVMLAALYLGVRSTTMHAVTFWLVILTYSGVMMLATFFTWGRR